VKNPDLTNLLFDDFFRSAIHNAQVCQINIAATVSIGCVVTSLVVGRLVVGRCSALPTVRPMAHYRVHTNRKLYSLLLSEAVERKSKSVGS